MGDLSGAPPTPSAEGTLAARPLSHLLVYTRSKRLTGRLVLRAPDGSGGAIALWRGQIAAARTTPPRAYFGMVAAEMGFVDRPTAEATQQEAAHRRCLHGELLIGYGRITPAQRDAVLAEQTCRKVHHLLGAMPPASAFAFYEDPPSAAEPPLSLDPVAPLWRALRDGASSGDIRGVLTPVIEKPIAIVNEGPVARAGFSSEEKALLEKLIAKPMTIVQMRNAFPSLTPDRIDRFVYLLLITKSGEPVMASAASVPAMPAMRAKSGSMDADAIAAALKQSLRPPTAPAFMPSAFPPPSSTRLDTKPGVGPTELGAAGIALRAKTIEHEDPFQTLAVPPNASVEAVRTAYLTLVKMWHPDRLPPQLASVRGEVGKIFAAMTQAHHTLTDADARRTFLAARTEPAVARRPRGEVLRHIDMALTKKDFSSAADESRKLLAADQDDAEAQSLVAWVATLAGEGPENTVRAALPVFDRAITRDAQCTRAHFYRGMLNKRLGNTAGAYRDFARAAQLDPKHVDAAREVRIHEMRMKKT